MFTALVWLILSSAHAQKSCLPAHTAAQVFWTFSENSPSQAQKLVSDRSGQLIKTRVQLEGHRAGGEVNLSVKFDPTFDGVSLPYNLYAVLIVREGTVEAWWDFTESCRSPGLSFFPGREIRLPAVKVIGEKPEQLQIMVWGKL